MINHLAPSEPHCEHANAANTCRPAQLGGGAPESNQLDIKSSAPPRRQILGRLISGAHFGPPCALKLLSALSLSLFSCFRRPPARSAHSHARQPAVNLTCRVFSLRGGSIAAGRRHCGRASLACALLKKSSSSAEAQEALERELARVRVALLSFLSLSLFLHFARFLSRSRARTKFASGRKSGREIDLSPRVARMTDEQAGKLRQSPRPGSGANPGESARLGRPPAAEQSRELVDYYA